MNEGTLKDIFVARQPIFSRMLDVFGYELLYRSGNDASAGRFDGNQATSQVILNTYMEIGLEAIVGERRAFINLTKDFLERDLWQALPKNQVVLEVLEDVQPTPRIIQALQGMALEGYTIALDDFVYRRELEPLVEVADIIKVDLLATPREQLAEHVELLRRADVKLLAEKIETQEDFTLCKQLAFDYYQGFFFARPTIIKGKRLPANRLAMLRLLARIHDPDVEVAELERLVGQDVSLSYKLLRYINSPFFGLRQEVSSIQQAIVLIGLKAIKMWATLISLSGIQDKPDELVVTAMVRARMCEALAEAMQLQKEMAFTVGLFSILDAVLDMPMEEIVTSLPLANDAKAALLRYEGAMGSILKSVIAYERGQWDNITEGGGTQSLSQRYIDSLKWANDAVKELLD